MKVSQQFPTELLGLGNKTPDDSGALFAAALEAVEANGDVSAKVSEPAPVAEGEAIVAAPRVATAALPVEFDATLPAAVPDVHDANAAEPEDPALPLEQVPQVKAGQEEVLKGPGNDLEHQKMWRSKEDLTDFAKQEDREAPVGNSPSLPIAAEKAEDVPLAEEASNAEGAPHPKAAKVEPHLADPSIMLPAPTPPIKTAERPVSREMPADEEHEERSEAPAATTLVEPDWAKDAVEVADAAAAPAPVSAQAEVAVHQDARRDVATAKHEVALPRHAPVAVPSQHAHSDVAQHVVKMLHQIDVLDEVNHVRADAEPAILEAKVVDAPAVELKVAEVKSERAAGPVNLGRPVLAMVTQETLQESVAPRGDSVPSSMAHGIVSQAAGVQPAVAPANAGLTPHLASAHHVVATSAQHLAADLGVHVARGAREGKNEVAIRLDPAELGRVDIRMTFDGDGRMRAVIAADNPSTFDLLRRDIDTLVRTLNDAGVKTNAGDLRFDMKQGGHGEHNSGHGGNSPGHRYGSDDGEAETAADSGAAKRTTRGRLV